jgi:hypothetical protein
MFFSLTTMQTRKFTTTQLDPKSGAKLRAKWMFVCLALAPEERFATHTQILNIKLLIGHGSWKILAREEPKHSGLLDKLFYI